MYREKSVPAGKKLFLGKPLSLEAEAKLFGMTGSSHSTAPLQRPSKIESNNSLSSLDSIQNRTENPDKGEKRTKWKKKPLSHDEQQKFERLHKIKSALKWLCENFPDCFNNKDPKPLKLRIEADLFPLLEDKETPPSKKAIREAIGFYTRSRAYLEAISSNNKRFDIHGLPGEEIDQKHKAYSLEVVKARDTIKGAASLKENRTKRK